MKRRDFLRSTGAAASLSLLSRSTPDEKELNYFDTVLGALADVPRISLSNPARGYLGYEPATPTEIEGPKKFELVGGGADALDTILEDGTGAEVAYDWYESRLTHWRMLKDREFDVNYHAVGVADELLDQIRSEASKALNFFDLNQSTERYDSVLVGDMEKVNDPSGYEGGEPEENQLNPFRTEHTSDDRIDVMLFEGDNIHGWAHSPGMYALAVTDSSEDDFWSISNAIHELGHAFLGAHHHETVGPMTYNWALAFEHESRGEEKEYYRFGDFTDPQIKRVLEGDVKIKEESGGDDEVYVTFESPELDPENYDRPFTENLERMLQILEGAADITVAEKMHWQPVRTLYTEDKDYAVFDAGRGYTAHIALDTGEDEPSEARLDFKGREVRNYDFS